MLPSLSGRLKGSRRLWRRSGLSFEVTATAGPPSVPLPEGVSRDAGDGGRREGWYGGGGGGEEQRNRGRERKWPLPIEVKETLVCFHKVTVQLSFTQSVTYSRFPHIPLIKAHKQIYDFMH